MTETADKITELNGHVYFYQWCEPEHIETLSAALIVADSILARRERAVGTTNLPVHLHIMSGGGDPTSAMAVADQIIAMERPVYGYIEGWVASAATLIAIACDRRFIRRHAFFLIHSLETWMAGDVEDLVTQVDFVNRLSDVIAGFYAERTNLSVDTVAEMLRKTTFLSAEECVQHGFATEVL